jgi:hypothetical protein
MVRGNKNNQQLGILDERKEEEEDEEDQVRIHQVTETNAMATQRQQIIEEEEKQSI